MSIGDIDSSSSLYSHHQHQVKNTMPGAFPSTAAPQCLEESTAFRINGFETINDKVLREMNERAKNIVSGSSTTDNRSPRKLNSFTSVKYSPPVSRSLASTAAAAARSPNRSPKRGHHKRYSSVHRRAFAKMESIASHYSARARLPADQGEVRLPVPTSSSTTVASTERRVNETELHNDTRKNDFSDKRTSSRVVTNASKRRRMDALGRKIELRSSTSRQNLARLAAQQEAKRMAEMAQNHNSPAFTSTQIPARAPLSPIAQRTVSQPSPSRRMGSGSSTTASHNYPNSSSSRIPSLSYSAAFSGQATTTPRSPSTKSISAISVCGSQGHKPSAMPASPSLSKIPVTTSHTAPPVKTGLRKEPLSPIKRVESMLNQLPPPPRARDALSKARLEARMAALKTCSPEKVNDEEESKSDSKSNQRTIVSKASAPSLKSRLSGSASRLFKKSPSLANLKESHSGTEAKPKTASRLPRSQGFAAPTQSSIGRLMRSQAAAKSSPNLKALS